MDDAGAPAYGALLVLDGKHAEAERVFLRDLEVTANGWAAGLRDALAAQGRVAEAEHADRLPQRLGERRRDAASGLLPAPQRSDAARAARHETTT